MLDKDMTAKLGDFGLSSIAEIQTLTLALALESDPYAAPELNLPSAASERSDVYSFGMVALQVLCGRSPEELVPWVWSMHEKGQLWDVLDPFLGRASGSEFFENVGAHADAFRNQVDFDWDEVKHRQQITRALRLAMACTLPEPYLRPHSNRLIQALYDDWPVTLPPSFSTWDASHLSQRGMLGER